MGTFYQKKSAIVNAWHLIDANNQTLGRLATQVARLLLGKHKPEYSPHLDFGDYVVIINAAKIRVTGKKLKDKIYYHYSGYQSGIKAICLGDLLAKAPDRAIKEAVKNMLPKGPKGRKIFGKLKVYPGAEHPHTAQKLKAFEIEA